MAEIDLKFMKGNRKLAKAMGSTYVSGKGKAKKSTGTKKRGKK